jgi:hypothetical protein
MCRKVPGMYSMLSEDFPSLPRPTKCKMQRQEAAPTLSQVGHSSEECGELADEPMKRDECA